MRRPIRREVINAIRDNIFEETRLTRELNSIRQARGIPTERVVDYLGLDLEEEELALFGVGDYRLHIGDLVGYAAFMGISIKYELYENEVD